MELWLDTAEITVIKTIDKMGFLFGVTTNPSILANTGKIPEEVIKAILDAQAGPVAVQVTADNPSEMIFQARKLYAFSSRIIIKVPATPAGYETMTILKQEKIPVLATAVLHAQQALLAGLLKADYIAPYLSRMEQQNISYEKELKSILQICHQQQMRSKVMGAAIKDVQQVITCAELGIDAITLPQSVFQSLITPSVTTLESLAKFARDWENSHPKSKLFAIPA